ncbi:MAG: ATP-binding cassette domain-containing protein [Candidatus Omnitrophota bacterium]|nr:ATP-binding cassette domain-containing protein [Candidatus Omnitrophota bacterium]
MISINNLSKNYGQKQLFNNISLGIFSGEKIGLIGPNGAGKSTFFNIILGEIEPSAGSVAVNKNVRIGYLPQESSFHSERTVLAELIEGEPAIMRLKREKEELESSGAAGSHEYGEVLHRLESLDYFNLEHEAKKVLQGLGFKEKDFNRLIREMSGGWQMRVLLAKLLVHNYDLLLLDEPTNYLDLNAALWLKDFLGAFKGTFIMISHDKAFLNEVTSYTFILENGSVFKVQGNYHHYEKIKEEKRNYLIKQAKEQEKKKKDLEKFVARFHAQPNKSSQVRAKRTQLEKMEEIVIPADTRQSINDFSFPPTRRSGYQVMKLEKISKAYADIKVYEDFDFEISQGEKAVLAGENGAGKSTLLKILAGVIDIDKGIRKPGHNVDIGYFSQTRLDVLSQENTVLKEAYSAVTGYMSEENIRSLLGIFLFTGDDADKKVKVLSGGEKSRLILAKLLINPPNFLCLDEPTTHLDVDAVDMLIKALSMYEGTLVFITHDIHFVRSVANVVFEVKDARVRKYPGNFNYYLEKRAQVNDEAKIEVKVRESKKRDEKDKLKEEIRLLRHRDQEKKKHNNQVHTQMNRLNQEKENLDIETYAKARAMSNSKVFRDEEILKEYSRRIKEIEARKNEIDLQIQELKSSLLI